MNKYNPSLPSTKTKELLISKVITDLETKSSKVLTVQHKEVKLRLNGSIISNKPLSRRDLHRQEVANRRATCSRHN